MCVCVCVCRKRVLAVLQEMLVLPNTPISLISLLVEKLMNVLKDDDRRIEMVCWMVLSYTLTRVKWP